MSGGSRAQVDNAIGFRVEINVLTATIQVSRVC